MKENCTPPQLWGFALLLALALNACTSDDTFTQDDLVKAAEEQAGDAISFGVYLGQNGTTRAGVAGEITSADILKGTTATSAGTGNNNGFGVFAYNTGASTWSSAGSSTIPNFMYNERVYWESSSWKYDVIKYWPNGTDAANAAGNPSNTATETATQYLSFFAYAPYTYVSLKTVAGTSTAGREKIKSGSETGYEVESRQLGEKGVGITDLTANGTSGAPIVTYALPSTNPTGKNTVDLLWGTRGKSTYTETDNVNNSGTIGSTYNTDLTKQTVDEHVKFLFKHALAKIDDIEVVYDIDGNGNATAGAGSDDAYTLVTISNVSIAPNTASDFYKDGKFNLATGTWDMTGATYYGADASIMGSNTLNEAIAEPAAASCPEYSSGWKKHDKSTSFDGVRKSPKDLFSSFDPIMFIPGGNTPVLKVTVTYVVRTYDEKLNASSNDDSNATTDRTWSKVTQTITNTVTLPTLAPNKKYKLVMHLGLTSVKFEADIADWDDSGTTEQVWLPSNVLSSSSTTTSAAAGSSITMNVAADATPVTVNLTGLTNGNKVYCSAVTGSGIANVSNVTLSPTNITEGKSTATITLTANTNTSETVTSTATIIEYTDSNSNNTYDDGTDAKASTTTITIIQAKKPADP